MIDKYLFGLIVIEGREYNYDVEVRWTGEVLEWRRKKGHIFDVEDVKRAIERSPEVIILGTGAYGMASIAKECQEFMQSKKIKIVAKKTSEAIEIFNSIQSSKEQKRVIGLFHLTC